MIQWLRKNATYHYVLLALWVYALVMPGNVAFTSAALQTKHIIGLVALGCTTTAFFINSRLGIVLLGITMLAALFALLSVDFSRTFYFNQNLFGWKTQIAVQPRYLLHTILLFWISGKYYSGIGTAAYWRAIFQKKPVEG